MILIDVTILVAAHRTESARHHQYRDWFRAVRNGDAPFGVPALALSGFLRIATHSRIFADPTPPRRALQAVEALTANPLCRVIQPGLRHWGIFVQLSRDSRATGNLVPDAYLAAMAIESNAEWITADRGFARFPGLRWRHPLD